MAIPRRRPSEGHRGPEFMQSTMQLVPGQEVSGQSQTASAKLIAERPSAAVAVLQVRFDPTTGVLMFKLKSYNEKLQQLNDIPAAITSADPHDTWIMQPVFFREDTAAIFTAAMQRCLTTAYLLCSAQINNATMYCLNVSRTGRLSKVRKELWAVTHAQHQCEFMLAETVLPDGFEFTSDLQTPYHVAPPVARERRASEPAVSEQCRPAIQWASERAPAKHKTARSRSQGHFVCLSCGATETAQKRY